MDMFGLIAAFGGGLLGAAVGALPAFILAGVIAIAGGILGMAGIAEPSIGNIAFGSFLGPHIAFAGGVAAAAYAGKIKKLSSGADILSSLNGLADASVLVVGGVFGVLGFLVKYVYGDLLQLPTDHPGITVFTLAIITRFVFGQTGLFGQYKDKTPRVWFSTGSELVYNIILGLGIGIIVSGVAVSMLNSGVSAEAMGMFPIVCFGISAFSLIFAQTGFASPTTHHITLPAASAAVMTGNIFIGIIVAIICTLFGDLVAKSINSYCDTHIDPPATTIFIAMFIINILFG